MVTNFVDQTQRVNQYSKSSPQNVTAPIVCSHLSESCAWLNCNMCCNASSAKWWSSSLEQRRDATVLHNTRHSSDMQTQLLHPNSCLRHLISSSKHDLSNYLCRTCLYKVHKTWIARDAKSFLPHILYSFT